MPYSVHFAADVDVPADLRPKVFEIVREIAASMESIPASSAFWSAANAGNAELNMGGWQFEYRIHHRDRRILIVNVRRGSGRAV